MTALDYPMDFGFKAQDGKYYGPNGTVGLYHLGNDYYAPLNTPLLIQSTQLGLSGNTGVVAGPHVHVAKWKSGNVGGGYFVSKYDRSYFDPSDVKGISGSVSETGYDSTAAGKYVRIAADNGYTYEFFHLNRVDVKINDKIGAITMEKVTLTTARIFGFFILGRNGLDGRPDALKGETDDDLKKYMVDKDLSNQFVYDLYQAPESKEYVKTLKPGEYVPYNIPELFIKKG